MDWDSPAQWDWPDWKDFDPNKWDDIKVARVWQTVLGDYLQLGVKRRALSLYGDVLRDFYMGPMVAQLNEMTPLLTDILSGPHELWVPTKPKLWPIRMWRKYKRMSREGRVAFGHWVGGTKPSDDDWYD